MIKENKETRSSTPHIVFQNANDDDDEIDIYTSYASYMSSSDPGSDNILVTFDYGSQYSLEADILEDLPPRDDDENETNLFKIQEESSEDLLNIKHPKLMTKSQNLLMNSSNNSSKNLLTVPMPDYLKKSQNFFEVHQMQHNMSTRTSSRTSVMTSMLEYNVDTSGDYGSWQQSDSEDEKSTTDRNYCYEDLIKNENIEDVDDDNDIASGANGNEHDDEERNEVLINFNFDEASSPPRWFTNNEKLYYKSVDYLN